MFKLHNNFINLKIVSFKSKRRRLFGQCSCYPTSKQGYLLFILKLCCLAFYVFLIFYACCSYDKQKTCWRAIPKVVSLCRYQHGFAKCRYGLLLKVVEGGGGKQTDKNLLQTASAKSKQNNIICVTNHL